MTERVSSSDRWSGFVSGTMLGALLASAMALAALLGLARWSEFAPALAFNGWTFAVLWLGASLLGRAPRPLASLQLLFVVLALFAAGLVFAHAWFFDVAIERRLTVLDMTRAGVAYFFTTSLPPRGLGAMLLVSFSSLAMGVAAARWRPRPPSLGALGVSAALLALSLPLLVRAPRVPSPLYDSGKEGWELLTLPHVAADAEPDLRLLPSLAKMDHTRAPLESEFTKVIVLVMETMTADTFEREQKLLPKSAFLERERSHLLQYSRYFPNNQDSRTGMLNMLFARVIPYEAYSSYGVEHYAAIARTPSLVDRMRAQSYRTAFAVSQTTLEEVVADLSWDETLRLDPRDIEQARAERKLCFTPDEYESSCEDLALLPKVVDFVVQNPRAFVYQEFIWGHAAEYNEASGKTNTEYYSAYVDALLAALTRAGVADQTLLAITSDHGFRDKGRQHERAVYRIPLLFHAARFSARSDARLLSHVDFGRLLFGALLGAPPESDHNPLVMIVGPTGQGHLYTINEQGGTMLLREKLGVRLVVHRAGTWEHSAERVLATFEEYRRTFDRALQAAPP